MDTCGLTETAYNVKLLLDVPEHRFPNKELIDNSETSNDYERELGVLKQVDMLIF